MEKKAGLYAYQEILVKWMRIRERYIIYIPDNIVLTSKIGILCNPPGTGKTRCFISLIEMDGEHDMQTLVITSRNKLRVWVRECELFNIRYHIVNRAKNIQTDYMNYRIVIVFPEIYNELVNQGIHWKRVIYDSPFHNYIQKMKIPCFEFIWISMHYSNQLLYHSFHKDHFFHGFRKMNTQLLKWVSIQYFNEHAKKSILLPEPVHHYEYKNPSLKMIVSCLEENINNHSDEIIRSSFGVSLERKYILDICEFDIKILQMIWKTEKKLERFPSHYSFYCPICISDDAYIWIQPPCCFRIVCAVCLNAWFEYKLDCPNCRKNICNISEFLYIIHHPTKNTCLKIFTINPENAVSNVLKKISFQQTANIVLYAKNDADESLFHSYFPSASIYTLKDKNSNICNYLNNDKNSHLILIVHDDTLLHGFEFLDCTDMIFLHDQWTFEQKIYMIGRTHRIGRSAKLPALNVYHLL